MYFEQAMNVYLKLEKEKKDYKHPSKIVYGKPTNGRPISRVMYSSTARTFSSSNLRPTSCSEIGRPSNTSGLSVANQYAPIIQHRATNTASNYPHQHQS
jgi:hypothetical protein